MLESEEGSIREILGSAAWQLIRQRLEWRLDQVRLELIKQPRVSPEEHRRTAYLQGEEAFLDALLEDPRKVLDSCQPKEPTEGAPTRPPVGHSLLRSRPRGV